MSRSKKSRKEGALMKAILPKRTPKEEKEKRIRKKSGNKPGSRQVTEAKQSNQANQSAQRDPRLGSKKPIALGVEQVTHSKPAPKPENRPESIAPVRVVDNSAALEQELLALENNEALQTLAARDEAGEALTEEQQSQLQAGLARYQELVSELGLEQEQDEDVQTQESSQVSEEALWDKLDDYDFSEYQEDKEK
ncbi:GTPase-activating protein [Thalassotalea litorea]|uniref:GTPase-activating protein n=1 Tax=Thalassotalea litorea TaxID=2020715 RepID=A0A5R9IQV1_9GAMM|nr:Der GTPase-activating protein YihI [Thalassotalea litorea]TLU65671.1 GTPase-activating protein [Thalassotalea litorea]